ncbi:hypothetical protein ACWIUD_03725, partial [Helicobacter sp. 23-1044]
GGNASSRARIRGSLKNPRSMDELVLSSLEFFGTTHESIARYFRTGRFFWLILLTQNRHYFDCFKRQKSQNLARNS